MLHVPGLHSTSVVHESPLTAQKPATQGSAQSVLLVQESSVLLQMPEGQLPAPQVALDVQTVVLQPGSEGCWQMLVRLSHLAGASRGRLPQQSLST